MSNKTSRILLTIAVTLSLLTLPSTLPGPHLLPSLNQAKAAAAPPSIWTPAGPASNNLEIKVFVDGLAECAALFAAPPAIDATDGACGGCGANPNYFLTASGWCYSSYWQNVIDGGLATGTFNFFTPLDAYSTGVCIPAGCTLAGLPPSPPLAFQSAGTFREGFVQTPSSLNPYVAQTAQDLYVLGGIYDHLYRLNPVDNSQILDWMVQSTSQMLNQQLTYIPPPGTTVSLRETIRNDIFWQDGQKVTPLDMAFTYLSLIAAGAAQNPANMVCPSATCQVTGITVLSPSQFDINLSTITALTQEDLGSVTVLPGHIWSACPWAGFNPPLPAIFPVGFGGCLSANPALTGPAVDPIQAINPTTGLPGILIGSGPWTCQNTGFNAAVPVGTMGTGCSSSNSQSPPAGGLFQLTRFGCSYAPSTCVTPASSLANYYFRSGGNLALWFWSGNSGNFAADFVNFGVVAGCFAKPIGTPGCTLWQEGVGNPATGPIGLVQASEVSRYVGFNWINPWNWQQAPPTGIVAAHPVILERTSAALAPAYTLNPKPIAGCAIPANQPPVAGAAYPNGGGYDC